MFSETKRLVHWADGSADRIIRTCGDKESYTIASGITPSGQVHFGNFREVITTEFVGRALQDRGKKVRFLFSWDDYDTFRKIPQDVPAGEALLKPYLYRPIVDVPDPYGKTESYAAYHRENFERSLKKVGIHPEFLYQAQKYRSGEYYENIKKALDHAEEIRSILNAHRTTPLLKTWTPISIYCGGCGRDRDILDIRWDGTHLSYRCRCGHEDKRNLKEMDNVKLPWRIDWPMRWAYEGVDFEPGGKDHSSEGGSFTTAKKIVNIFGGKAPVHLQYDFVGVKGRGGKMSSSAGDVVTLDDVLKVYSPEMVRWIFARYKPNLDFSISFDLDVLKTYEDYDRQELSAYGNVQGNPKKIMVAKRTFELSRLTPKRFKEGEIITPLFQAPFRHLTNILQIYQGDFEKVQNDYRSKGDVQNERDEQLLRGRARCALYWLRHYAPEDFCFSLRSAPPSWESLVLEVGSKEKDFVRRVKTFLAEERASSIASDKELHNELYRLIGESGMEPKKAFRMMYQILIGKDKGPKLAGFMRIVGIPKINALLYRLE